MRHELYLARAGFAALAVIAAVSAVVGAVAFGTDGARTALIGVGLVATNHAAAVASTSWSRTLSPRVVAVGYGVFVLRMLFVVGVFGTLQSFGWVHTGVLAGSFCAALVASLAAECISYVRGSYVPTWMRRQVLSPEWRSR